MKIAAFDCFRFSLPLKSEMVFGGSRLSKSDGYILRLADEFGTVGAGEIAPLIGFSDESLEEAAEDVARLRFSVYQSEVPPHLEELSGGFEQWIGKLRLCPSVRFGFESATLRLLARSRQMSLPLLMSETTADIVHSQGLLAGDVSDILAKVEAYYARGYRTFKVKVGREGLVGDVALLTAIRSQLPDDVVIRADANRGWDVDTALGFLKEAKTLGVDYVEEPVRSWEELQECCALWDGERHAPIALDEHLGQFSAETLPNIEAISTLILKPSLMGVEASARMARRADLLGKGVVYSSPFESSVGFAMTASLAAVGNDTNTAHGFDANSWLQCDLPGLSVQWSGSGIRLDQFVDIEERIRWAELEEVALD